MDLQIKYIKQKHNFGSNFYEPHLVDIEHFLKTNWNVIQSNYPYAFDEEKIIKLRRNRWFCNLTEIPIAQLQKYNAIDDFRFFLNNGEEFEKLEEDVQVQVQVQDCISNRLMKEDPKYCSFRVFDCGHCFYDVHLISAVLDKLNYCYDTSQQIRKNGTDAIVAHLNSSLSEVFGNCMCKNYKHNSNSKLNLYCRFNNFSCGTIILSDVITKCNLGAIIPELMVGDVVDINGYRGTGLIMYLGMKMFEYVYRFEYYPIWLLHWTELRGYFYYLNLGKDRFYCEGIDFRSLTGNGYIRYEPFDPSFSDGCDEFKYIQTDAEPTKNTHDEPKMIDITDGKLVIHSNNSDKCWTFDSPDEDGYYQMSYPFIDANHAICLLRSNCRFKTQLPTKETLIFREGSLYIRSITGEEICADCF